MKRIPLFIYCLFVGLIGSTNVVNAATLCKKGEFCIRREPSSHTCTVQEPTERPLFGDEWKGPFATRALGTKKMCELFDAGSERDDKCAAVRPADACKPRAPQKKTRETRADDTCTATVTYKEAFSSAGGPSTLNWDIRFDVTVGGCADGSNTSGTYDFKVILHDLDTGAISSDARSDAWTNVSGSRFVQTYKTQYPSNLAVLRAEEITAKCTCI